MRSFSKQELTRRLRLLAPGAAVLFGQLCLRRRLPAYDLFANEAAWGDPELLWSIVSESPQHLLSRSRGHTEAMREEVRRAVPDSDQFAVLAVGDAQEAALGVECLLDYALDGDSADIAQIAAFAVDTLDRSIQERERLDPASRALEQTIDRHPLMQRELASQARDLEIAEQYRD